MAHLTQALGVVKLDSATGTDTAGDLTDYSDEIISATLSLDAATASPYWVLNSRAAKTMDGGYSGNITLNVVVDPDATSLYSILADWLLDDAPGARQFEAYSPDDDPGSLKYACNVRIRSMSPAVQLTGGTGDVQQSTVTLVTDGAITQSVVT